MRLSQHLRQAAVHADAVSPVTAIWLEGYDAYEALAAERLWDSFTQYEFVPVGNVAVLGLLLLAEVLEAA